MKHVMDTCRFCGAQDETTPELDPAPHVCPTCLDERMATLTLRMVALMGTMSEDQLRAQMRTALIEEVGMLPDWADDVLRGDALIHMARTVSIVQGGYGVGRN